MAPVTIAENSTRFEAALFNARAGLNARLMWSPGCRLRLFNCIWALEFECRGSMGKGGGHEVRLVGCYFGDHVLVCEFARDSFFSPS